MEQKPPSPRAACALSLIVPAYNEAHALRAGVQSILSFYDARGIDGEVIVVDDGSADATPSVCRELAARDPRVIPVLNAQNRGKWYAVRAWVEAARGRRVGFTDADLSYPIEQVPTFLQKLDEGFDGAIWCRRMADTVFSLHPSDFPYIYLRHMIGHLFNLVVRAMIPIEFSDTQCGLKIFTREAATQIFRRGLIDDFCFDVEVLFLARNLGFRIAAVPVHYRYSRQRSSVALMRDSLRMIAQLLQIRRNYRGGRYRMPACGTISMPGDYQFIALTEGHAVQRRWHANKLRLMERIGNVVSGDVVLDAGCGSGLLTAALAKNAARVYGVDLNGNALAFASRSSSCPRAHFARASLGRLPFRDGAFTKVFCEEVIEHVPPDELTAILAEFVRTTAPGGYLIFTTPNYASGWVLIEKMANMVKVLRGIARDEHINRFTPSRLASLMSAHPCSPVTSGSINHFSPFAAPLSPRWADRFLEWELKPRRRGGNLLYAVFRKSTHAIDPASGGSSASARGARGRA